MFKGIFDFKNQKIVIRWEILYPVFFYFIISMLILNSTSNSDSFIGSTFYKQILWFGIGSVVFIVIQFVRLQYLYDYASVSYTHLRAHET